MTEEDWIACVREIAISHIRPFREKGDKKHAITQTSDHSVQKIINIVAIRNHLYMPKYHYLDDPVANITRWQSSFNTVDFSSASSWTSLDDPSFENLTENR